MYNMAKPSSNMNMSQAEVNRMIHEQAVEEYNKEQDRIKREASETDREYYDYNKYCLEYSVDNNISITARNKFLRDAKNALMTECIFKLYKDCSTPLTRADKVIVRNMVSKFVTENGVDNLISDFATKNLLLSEFSRITTKYYNRIVEECEDCNDPERAGKSREFIIGDNTKDDFFDELDDVDTSDASKLIKERVADAVSDFTNNNAEQKLEYEEIINSAKDKMAVATDESFVEEFNNMAKRNISEKKLKMEKNVFHCMVESLSKKAFKDDAFKAKYLNEATLDMNNIVNDTLLIYTMLEMTNTTNMVNVNENYMKTYIESL